MRKKPRNALIENESQSFIDLGTINMKSVDTSFDRMEIVEPQNWSARNKVIVGVHKIYNDVETPKYYTQKSACFDIPVYLGKDVICVDTYNRMLMHLIKTVAPMQEKDGERGFSIEPGESAFVPTGLIFDIPENFKISIYPRSGTSR